MVSVRGFGRLGCPSSSCMVHRLQRVLVELARLYRLDIGNCPQGRTSCAHATKRMLEDMWGGAGATTTYPLSQEHSKTPRLAPLYDVRWYTVPRTATHSGMLPHIAFYAAFR